MDEGDWLAARFERHRTRLTAVAYRMLGSPSEADDVVQEAWLRFHRSDTSTVENLGSWLTTVVSRLCLNILHARRSRPEVPLDPETLNEEPVVSPDSATDPGTGDAAGRLDQARAAGGARHADTRGARRVRPARHVRRVVRGDRADAAITAPYMTGRPLPAQRWSNVTMPTLVLDGELSPSFLRDGAKALAGILPNATSDTFPGQGHGAPPEMVAPVLTSFFLAN